MVNGWRASNHKALTLKWVQTIVQRSHRFWYYVFFRFARMYSLRVRSFRTTISPQRWIIMKYFNQIVHYVVVAVVDQTTSVWVERSLYRAMGVLYCPRGFPSTMSDSTSCSLTFAALYWSILRQLTITNEKQMICFSSFFDFICVSSHSVHSTPCTRCSSLFFTWIDKNEWDQANSHIGDVQMVGRAKAKWYLIMHTNFKWYSWSGLRNALPGQRSGTQ